MLGFSKKTPIKVVIYTVLYISILVMLFYYNIYVTAAASWLLLPIAIFGIRLENGVVCPKERLRLYKVYGLGAVALICFFVASRTSEKLNKLFQ